VSQQPLRAGAMRSRLNRIYALYTLAFLGLVALLAALEQLGLPRQWIGMIFLLTTVVTYAAIGVLSRTTDADEYYVAGRSVPAMYNGMATGADWMSAASFIGMAGTLYISGYAGLAFVMGWTGGYCLVALLLAPYLRRFGEFTIPDFLAARFGGRAIRLIAVFAVIAVSFIYVVAQIYGVGLITSRMTGVAFELGVFLGLGGILICSFLGGMRAVTWTQVAQYIVLIIAFMLPVVLLSVKQTGNPLPQLAYGPQLAQVSAKELDLMIDGREREVQALFAQRARRLEAMLEAPARTLRELRQQAERQVSALRAQRANLEDIRQAERVLALLPRSEDAAKAQWRAELQIAKAKSLPLNGMAPHAQRFVGERAEQSGDPGVARTNFLALMLCLMLGTAALPHVLVRYYTTPNVRQARQSVTWSLGFILLLYLTAPALAVMVKYEVFHHLVGMPISELPTWVSAWSRVDSSLLSIQDINRDGVLQLNELSIGADIIVLATPEIAGLPYVVSGLVAAGGLAAALSTADGLLLTVANALSHDVYYKLVDPKASTARRVTLSKMLLLVVALAAAYVAAQKPADILFLVSAAFSFAASAFFPALVLGIFWRRANGVGAIAGMVSGLAVTMYYMVVNQPWLRASFGIESPVQLWWGIEPISAGVFGVPVGALVMVAVSLVTAAPSAAIQSLMDRLRSPD
jgi:cation/acetate symporter